MPNDFYLVVARYYPRKGETETVLDLLAQLAESSRSEKANLGYEYFRGVRNTDEIVIIERYVDAAGFAAHRDSEHFQRLGIGQIIPLLENRVIEKMNVALDA